MNVFEFSDAKQTSRILLFRPNPPEIELNRLNKNVYIFPSPYAEIIDEHRKHFDYSEIVGRIREWGPLLSRHLDRGDQFELVIQQLASKIIDWTEEIIQSGCTYAIFETSAAHHMDTFCFELACDMAGIKKIFLEYSAFGNRLIPIMQVQGYESRRRLGCRLNNWQLPIEFVDINHSVWRERVSIGRRRNQSDLYAVIVLCQRNLRKVLSKWAKNCTKFIVNSSPDFFWPETLSHYSLLTEIKVIWQQRKSLRFLKRLHLDRGIDKLDDTATEQVILVMAHTQPEASSYHLGGKNWNHINIIRQLINRFPNHTIIYREHPHIVRRIIRGHPSRVGISRSVNYFKELEKLGCLFFNGETNSQLNEILNRTSTIVVTISGKVAVERAIRGQVTVFTGYPWYSDMPGVLSFSEFLSKPIDVINWRCDPQSVIKWIIEAHSGTTLAPGPWTVHTTLSAEHDNYYQDLENLIDEIEKFKIL